MFIYCEDAITDTPLLFIALFNMGCVSSGSSHNINNTPIQITVYNIPLTTRVFSTNSGILQ